MENENLDTFTLEEQNELIERHFRNGKGLSADYINAYAYIDALLRDMELEKIKPVKTYREYLMNTPEYYHHTMELSDDKAIAELDRLVNEFNSDVERIKREKDANTVRNFIRSVNDLVK